MINQLYDLSVFYNQIRIPYLIKFMDFFSYFGIKIRSKVIPKENQVVALGFFLQSIKGISKSMTYIQLLEHIKESEHDTIEFNQYTHLFEIIYSFPCPTKNAYKAIYTLNQEAIVIDKDKGKEKDSTPITSKEFTSKIEILFSTEDPSNGFVNINVLLNELSNAQNEIKSFFYHFHIILSKLNSIASVFNSVTIPKRLVSYKNSCLSKYNQVNPFKIGLSYYNYYIDLYQINSKASNAKEYLSNRIPSLNSIPHMEWVNMIIKPFGNMKICIMDKVVKFKTDISSLSVQSKEKVLELSKEVIDKIKNQYGEISAFVIVKNQKEIIVVLQKRFAVFYEKFILNYVKMIEMINFKEAIVKLKEIICCYNNKWLKRDENEFNETDRPNETTMMMSWSDVPSK